MMSAALVSKTRDNVSKTRDDVSKAIDHVCKTKDDVSKAIDDVGKAIYDVFPDSHKHAIVRPRLKKNLPSTHLTSNHIDQSPI